MSSNAAAQSRVSLTRTGYVKPIFWMIFALMFICAIMFSSLPILKPTHPLHFLLYSQRWLLIPHMAGGLIVLALGPLQFSSRLRQRNPARHRLLGIIYVGSALVSALMAPILAWHYPAFFPYSVTANATIWLVSTLAAFIMARNRQFDSHRRWMARSYAMAATFVLPRIPIPIAAYQHQSLEAASYSLLLFTLFALLTAELIVDFNFRRPSSTTVPIS